jgi:peptidoglycan/xylan/chitin deacetylase (PgdA/CDA1 family)
LNADVTPTSQAVAIDDQEGVKELSWDVIPATFILAVENQEQVKNVSIDTMSTSQHVAVNNPELIGELSIGTIPINNPAVLDEKELAIESMGTVPTILISGVSNPQQSGKLSTNAIPITPIPAINNLALSELSANILPFTPTPIEDKERSIAVDIEKIPTAKLPVVVKQRKHKGLSVLIVGVVSILLFTVIGSAFLLWSPNLSFQRASQQTHPRSQRATPATARTPAGMIPTATSTDDASEVKALGQQYMNALLNQRYDTMWSLLHPQVQMMWPNETSFSNYWKTRFQGFTLQQFKLGQAHSLSFWVNPETMIRYNQVEVLPISLQLSPQVSADKLTLLPTLDQNPSQLFQNLPLIAQRTVIQMGRETVDQWLILSGGPADLEAPILPPITPVSRKINMPILMYHHITNAPTHNMLDLSLTVTPNVFGQQLDYLKQHGYHTITFNQLFDFLYYNGPLPNKPIILTFDDGYDDAYTFAYPILRKHGYSGMFYIITGKVGWKGQATWDQLCEMLANGMQMGSHTITHRNMGEVWRISPQAAQQEFQQSRQDMQTRLGVIIQQFCYPTGEPFHHEKPVVQQAIMALLEQDGYIGATTDPPPVGMTQDSQKPFILLRVRVDGRESLQEYFNSLP